MLFDNVLADEAGLEYLNYWKFDEIMDYYIAVDGRQQGPFSLEDLLMKELGRNDLVWHEGMEQWAKAAELPELAAYFESRRAVPPPLPEIGEEPAFVASKPPREGRSPLRICFYIVFTVAVLLGGIYGAAALRDASERHRAQQEKERMEDYRKQQRLLREQEEAERRRREQRIAELYAQDKTIQKHLNELKELYDEAEEFHWFRLPSEKERQLRTLREKRDAYLEDRRAIRLELQSLGEDVELI